ncbi:MFS transporter [Aromatoleum toluvorans]|uniref:MFS transporter n=1 Tax=Aromatoleum toluvorans TaxID=92002 RepID=A0ABX1Q1M3_9RHOO|nr:MFS transporter [Aromatoleum toluvorans]NMG44409.1 MFS transporter [Aromatoleum toluvorans]
MFVGGFATFALLYAPQPILPRLVSDFAVAPTTASLAVSLGTAALAMMLLPASVLSDRYGRQPLMKTSLALATVIAFATALAADFNQLLVLRMLLGAVLAGLPASAMAWLGEEISPRAQGRAMGLYIAGNALGGMSGRFLVACITDWSSWRIAVATLAVLGLVATIVFWRCLPPSQHFRARDIHPARILADARTLFADAGLRRLFATAFLLMGVFTSLYNYLGFRLHAAPFGLGQSAIGAVFLLYFVGTLSSAWTGRLVDRIGRRAVLWTMILVSSTGLAVTTVDHLPAIVAGVAVFTFGYFGAHTTASGWVGRRAGERRALATAIYLCSYYLGASVIGTLSGLAWESRGWAGVTAALGVCIALAFSTAWRLRKLVPATSREALTV